MAKVWENSFARDSEAEGSRIAALRNRASLDAIPESATEWLDDYHLLRVLAAAPKLSETPTEEEGLLRRIFNVSVRSLPSTPG